MGVVETVGVVRLSRRPGLRIHPGENLGNPDVAHAPIRGLVLVADLVLEVGTRAVDLLWHRERIDRITLTKKEATTEARQDVDEPMARRALGRKKEVSDL